jgi:MFS family permease
VALSSVHESPRGHGRLVAGCLAALCVPLLVALAGFRRHTWTPVLDLAMTELRVRDVGGAHTPLIGLPGRIGTLADQGSHPGPLSFYALAPVYRVLGSTAWALQVATFVVHAVAMGTALVIAGRRGGARLVLVVAALLAVLTAGYGGGALTEPWNPYLPVLWWLVVLLAVWSVLCGDLVMLPVAVLAASFCAQTHVPYLGLALGMGALAAGAVAVRWVRSPGERGAAMRWVGAALGLGVLLWLPPTIDQVRHDPGNYRQLVEHFSDPAEAPRGLGEGIDVGLRYLDLAHLARGDVTDPGWLVTSADGNRPTSGRGVVLLALWGASAAVAVRRSNAALTSLHAVVGTGLVLMILAISRIFGAVWYYLTLWGWSIGLLALVATIWTIGDVVSERWTADRRAVADRLAKGALVALGLVTLARFSADAWDSPHADATVAAELAAVVDQASAGLDAGDGLATGHDGRYLVTWSDAFHIGSQGFGLLSELERRGFDVGAPEARRVPMTAHRVLDPSQATARVHLATGVFVDRWRQVPGAVEIAFVEPRDAADRAEQDRLHAEVAAALHDLGLDELLPQLDDNLFGAAIDERVPDAVQEQMGRMLEIGGPLAIFVVPVDTPEP